MTKTVKVEKPLTIDTLIRETEKCGKPVELRLKAGLARHTIATYEPHEFRNHLHNFRSGLEPPNWQREEVTLVLRIDDREIEFRAKPLS